MKIDLDNPEAIMYEWKVRIEFLNSRTGERFDPTPKGVVDWKPEATWISKRRFVLDALPDAEIKRGLFSKLAVVSQTFHEETGGMSLTGWQYEDLKQIWTRAYDQLTQFNYDNVVLRYRIRWARANMVERGEVRGKK